MSICAGNKKALLRALGFKGCSRELMWQYANKVLSFLEVIEMMVFTLLLLSMSKHITVKHISI